MTITTVGIDLAKNVFAVHGVDQNGKAVLVKPKVSRAALSALIAGLPPCIVGMEACSGAHYWARLFRQYDHDVRLMAPKFVSPDRMAGKTGKNDAADAIAILRLCSGRICVLYPSKTKASKQCNAYIGQDRDLFRKEQRRITVSGDWYLNSGLLSLKALMLFVMRFLIRRKLCQYRSGCALMIYWRISLILKMKSANMIGCYLVLPKQITAANS
jgi:hypothetical protein